MSNQYLITKCDKLCYQILLLRDVRCQRCGSSENLVPSHCYGKKAFPTLRHDLQNLLLFCDDCHKWWHKYPEIAGDWLCDKRPTMYKHLSEASRKSFKLNKEHYQDTAKALQAELKRLESDWGDLDPEGELPF